MRLRKSETKVFGVGVKGDHQTKVNGKHLKAYVAWNNMLKRCYRPNEKACYQGCSVADEWLDYGNFKKWHDDNYIDGYVLDKDLLSRGDKVYSPDNCCFIPTAINGFIIFSITAGKGKLPVGVHQSGRDTYYSTLSAGGKTIRKGSFSSVIDAFDYYCSSKLACADNLSDHYQLSDVLRANLNDLLVLRFESERTRCDLH